MSGPSLELGVAASGLSTVEKLNREVGELISRLGALPAAASNLKKLQAELDKIGTQRGGMGGGAKEIKGLAADIRAGQQAMATSLADLAEAIKKGYTAAARAKEAGEAQLRSKARDETGIPAFKARMLVGSAKIAEDQGAQAFASMARMMVGSLKIAQDQVKEAGKIAAAMQQADIAAQKIRDAAFDEIERRRTSRRVPSAKQVFEELEKGQDPATKRLDEARGFAALVKAEGEIRAKAERESAEAIAKGIKAADAIIDNAEKSRLKARNANQRFLGELARKDTSDFERARAQAQGGTPLSKDDAWEKIEQQRLAEAQRAASEVTKGFAALDKAAAEERNKSRLDSAKLEAQGIRAADALVAKEEEASAARRLANQKFLKQLDARTVSGQQAVANIIGMANKQAAEQAEADRIKQFAADKAVGNIVQMSREKKAAEEEASRIEQFARDKAVGNIIKMAEEEAAARDKEIATRRQKMQQAVDNILRTAHRKAEAEREAARIEAEAIKVKNALFMAGSQDVRDRRVLGARTQIDAGLPVESIRRNFGDAALAAAQATTFQEAYDKVHASVQRVGSESSRAAPRLTTFAKAMSDAHSAARGLASGFGALWMTWGNLAPLLAGAALSHSFVQSIKIGAQVRQDLEVLRVLSEESRESVKGLENQLISLGERGPFGPQQIAEAMRVLSLAGLNPAQVGAALKPSLNLAITGGVSIEKAAESLVAIGTAYGYQAEQFDRVSDIISKAAAISMSSVDGMMESFRSSSVVAQQYKVSLEDTATALALLANVGIQRSAAGTAVRQMFSELSGASRSTREAMKKLKVEIVETDKTKPNVGGFRPMLDIVRDLDKALSGLDPKSYQRAIQDMSNERGAKSLVRLLEALKEQAAEAGTTVQTELDRIAQAVKNSYGFTAIAAAQLASTPLNQMKGVVSSFQTALAEAFREIEPTVLAVSARLREAFNSGDFRGLVASLASTVANVSVFLIEHAEAIKRVVYAYALWKGAMIGIGLFTGMAQGIQALTVAWGALRNAKVAAAAATTAVATAEATATGAAVAGTGAAVARLAPMARFLAIMGPIGAAVGLAATAWSVYAATNSTANITEAEGTALRQGATLKALDEEIDRLKKLEEQLRKGTSAREADMIVAQMQAREQRDAGFKKAEQPLVERVESAGSKVESMLLRDPSLQDLLEGKRQPARRGTARSGVDTEFQNAVAERERALNALLALRENFGKAEAEQLRKEAEVRARAKAVAELQTKTPRKFGDKPWEDAFDPKKAAEEAAARAKEEDMLAALKARYVKQEQTLKQFYDQERKLLDESNRGKLISAAEYANRSEALSEAQYEAEKRNLQEYITDADDLLKKLQAMGAKATVLKTVSDMKGEAQQAQQLLAARRELTELQERGRINRSQVQLDTDLEKIREQTRAQEAKEEADIRSLYLTEQERAAAQARTAAESAYVEVLRKKNDELAIAEERLQAALFSDPLGITDDPAIGRLQAEIARLQAQRAAVEAARDSAGQRAAGRALEDPRNQPQWKQQLDAWNNHRKLMLDSMNEFKLNMQSAGEGIWNEFLKTGRVRLSSLADVFRDTFAKISYRKLIAGPMEQLSNGLWGWIEGAMSGRQGGQQSLGGPQEPASPLGAVQEAVSPLQAAFRSLLNPLRQFDLQITGTTGGVLDMNRGIIQASNTFPGALNTILSGIGSGFSNLMRELFSIMATASASSGGGGGFLGSLVSLAGSFFMGGAGTAGGAGLALPGGSVHPSDVGMSLALGGVVGPRGPERFAKGSVFSNRLFSKPTMFSFARGTKLGELGEAGTEAVMPLATGPGGQLGVKNFGGGGRGKVEINIINNGQPMQVTDKRETQTEDGGLRIDVIAEQIETRIASRVSRGEGPLHSATARRFGLQSVRGAPLQRPA